jgi:hypothetical protein
MEILTTIFRLLDRVVTRLQNEISFRRLRLEEKRRKRILRKESLP